MLHSIYRYTSFIAIAVTIHNLYVQSGFDNYEYDYECN